MDVDLLLRNVLIALCYILPIILILITRHKDSKIGRTEMIALILWPVIFPIIIFIGIVLLLIGLKEPERKEENDN